jgi:hypothetical protein
MAVARCDKHGPPVELKSGYRHRHVWKESGDFLCGKSLCTKPAHVVWLSDAEQVEYARGERFFFPVGKRHTAIEVI